MVANWLLGDTGARLIVALDPDRLTAPLRREPTTPGTYAWPERLYQGRDREIRNLPRARVSTMSRDITVGGR